MGIFATQERGGTQKKQGFVCDGHVRLYLAPSTWMLRE